MKCKTVILRKTNVGKIFLKKCNLFSLYFVRRGIQNCRLKDFENLDLTYLIFPPDCEIDRKGPDRKIDHLTGTLFILPNYRWLVNRTPKTHPPCTLVENCLPTSYRAIERGHSVFLRLHSSSGQLWHRHTKYNLPWFPVICFIIIRQDAPLRL